MLNDFISFTYQEKKEFKNRFREVDRPPFML